jgi:hypothetical protein
VKTGGRERESERERARERESAREREGEGERERERDCGMSEYTREILKYASREIAVCVASRPVQTDERSAWSSGIANKV